MTPEEQAIADAAVAFVRKHRTAIAKRLTDPAVYPPESQPVSVFMAGSPGAGKTEASKALIADQGWANVLRIDPDELRSQIDGYSGRQSWLFQGAVSLLVERVHDRALEQRQSFLLDGTLSSYEVALKNVNRSLKHGRTVQILYVYQEPALAWEFVQAREVLEGRNIRPEHFLEQYFSSRETVNRLKRELGPRIAVDLLLKNNDNTKRMYKAGVDQIDHHIPEKFSPDDVRRMLGI